MRDTRGRPADEYSSFGQVIEKRASGARAGKRAFVFLADGEAEAARLTFAELDAAARTVAAALERHGAAGEPVLLLYPPGLEFVSAFAGCLYAGSIAVPAYPERRGGGRLAAVVRDARPRLALTSAQVLSRMPAELAGELRTIATDELEPESARGFRSPAIGPDDVAFLQYTSGSTARPKGVRVTHGNLLANSRAISRAFGTSEETVVVGWLPVIHDMGLIGNVLQPMWCGGSCVLMSPMAFLQRPRRWLEAVTRYRATVSGGPDFAYELCSRKIPPAAREGLELSSWRVAFNGAEPVRAETLERFAGDFEPRGFRRRAFQPCYGLAEATLLVTAADRDAIPGELTVPRDRLGTGETVPAASGTEASKRLVACGRAGPEDRLLVVDPETRRPCPAGRVGEVWLAGPGVADGYWRRPEATRETFGARLADAGSGTFLRTGDLGFLDAGGELYLTGRLKDLVIVRGRNIHPQDVEATARASHPALATGGGAAFAVEDGGGERLVVVHEIDRRRTDEAAAAAEAVRRTVAGEHEAAATVVVIGAGRLPRTTSRKVRRRACREAYLAGRLGALAISDGRETLSETEALDRETLLALPTAERGAALEAFLRACLPAGSDDDGGGRSLGLDSLQAVELRARLESDLGLALSLELFLGGASVERVVAAIEAGLESGGVSATPALSASETAGEHPLSHGQRSLWFLHRLAPRSSAYNMAFAARVRTSAGVLDVAALRRALEALVERHPALRTTYHEVAGEPVQRVEPPPGRLDFEVVEPSPPTPLPEGEGSKRRTPPAPPLPLGEGAGGVRAARQRRSRDVSLEPSMLEAAEKPFDLERGPLARVRLFTGEPPVLLFAVHHVAADFWSLELLLDDLSRLYPEPRVLPPPALAYPDYVDWQSRLLGGPDGERLLAWWRGRLADVPAVLELPADRARPPAPSDRGDGYRFALGAEATGAVRAGAAAGGTTVFSVLLAAFQALIHRYTGSRRFVVGSPAAGRSRPELDGVVGSFVNLLPIPADLTGDPAAEELNVRTGRGVAAALERQDLPFPLLVERLEVPREAGRPPLVQVAFVLETPRRGALPGAAAFILGGGGAPVACGGLVLEPVALPRRTVQFELMLLAAELDGVLTARIDYATDLFDRATVVRMAGHLRRLLAEAVERPERRISRLDLFGEAERRQLEVEWNDTAAPRLRRFVHEAVAVHYRERPEAIAVRSDAGGRVAELSYGELGRRVHELAGRLRVLGAGPEVPVGVVLDRSPELPVALLAVLEAGGGFLAVDASDPARRIAWLLGDSGAPIVVTAEAVTRRLPTGPWKSVPFDAGPRGAGLAYLIYTSGSTGRAKGVPAHHGGLANIVAAVIDAMGLGPGSRVLQFASLAFDMSVLEVLAALASGATLCPAEARARLSGRVLGAAIRDGKLTHAILTPSVLGLLSEGDCPALTTILSGGEALGPALADRWSAGRRLLNGYGPAETTICSTLFPCLPGLAVAIGRPVASTRVYVVDRGFRSLPPVVPGELAVGGAGVTRGYLGRPSLTAERFVPDPFGALGARLYRTGDLARRRGDGSLEFLGRIDGQLKVRGVRIEPEEVEAALVRHPEVAAAAVARRGDRLVGYVVPEGSVRPSAAELRRFLSATLPDPMVPTSFVSLEALPLSRSGKVDRRALPDVEAPPEAAGVLPRTELERTVAAIWSEELGLETVGVDRNFFELGGHSLAMARIHARLCDVLGREVPLVEAFSHPTVSALAAHLEGGELRTAEEERFAAVQVRAAARGAAMSTMLRPRGGRPGRAV